MSPILANLFLHDVFDRWLEKHHPTVPWCRYADDGLVHCRSQQHAQQMLDMLRQRFMACGLQLPPVSPEKTKIVYCKDGSRQERHVHTEFGVIRHVNKALVRWARRKYKSLRHHKTRAMQFLERIAKQSPRLFVHWRARNGRCICLMGAV